MEIRERGFRPSFSSDIRHAVRVSNTARQPEGSDDAALLALVGAIASQRPSSAGIIALLLEHGAKPTDVDGNAKTVAAAASSDWIRRLLGSG